MSFSFTCISLQFEPSNEKTNKLGFRSGPTQTGLHSQRHDGSSKKRGCTSKNKGADHCVVTACTVQWSAPLFFAYADRLFSDAVL